MRHDLYGNTSPGHQKKRHTSTNPREHSPGSPMMSVDGRSSQAIREQQEKANNGIWDAITMKDYEKFQRQEQAKKIQKRDDQESMKKFLDNQVQEKQFKQSIDTKLEQNQHNQILAQIKKYDQLANQKYRNRQMQMQSQVKDNFSLIKTKQNIENLNKSQSVTEDIRNNSNYLEKIKAVDKQNLYDLKKMKEERKHQLFEELSCKTLKQKSSAMLTKLDNLKHMNDEFSLFQKNQERHKQKVKQLANRNDMIFNSVQKSPYKNLAVAERLKESKLTQEANQSFISELKKRNMIMDEMKRKKREEYMNLKTSHKQQIEDGATKKKQNHSIELHNDKIMIEGLKNHEQEMQLKERKEMEAKKIQCKKALEENMSASMSIDPSSQIYYTKEFELNRSLIKDISPNLSTLI